MGEPGGGLGVGDGGDAGEEVEGLVAGGKRAAEAETRDVG